MIAIPERILANWREWYGGRAEPLAAEVTERARGAIEAWGLELPRPMEGGEVSLVLEASREGRPVVCKVNPPDPALGREAVALASWRELCPRLLATRDADDTLLMERLAPGTPLGGHLGSVEEELRVVGALVRRLHRAEAPGVIRLADSTLAAEWIEALADERDRVELAELLEEDEVVIHTDLHADNVLEHHGEWRLIDPKPFRAAREAEIWALVDATDLPSAKNVAAGEMRRRLAIYCEAAGLDPETAQRWARLRALAEAELGPAGSEWQRDLSRVAEALAA